MELEPIKQRAYAFTPRGSSNKIFRFITFYRGAEPKMEKTGGALSSRREFLKGLTSATAGMLAGCSLVNSALAAVQNQRQSAAPRRKRRETVVGGRRVTTMDLHCHLVRLPDIWKVIPKGQAVPPYLEEDANTYRNHPIPLFNPRGPEVDQRLADMDEMGIDVQVLSINDTYYWAEPELARQIVQIQNEEIAELCAAHPDRFLGLATAALPYPDLAVEQLEEAVKKLGMRGVDIGGSANGEDLSAPKFLPFWAKAEQLGTLVFIHPAGMSGAEYPMDFQQRLGGNGWLSNVIGNPLETTIALSHLIQEGILDRFPGLKILAAHGGGFLPSYAGRSDQCLIANPDLCKPVKKKPSEYLKQIYYDSLVVTPEGLRHLIAEVGVSQIVLGTDYPTRWNRDGIDRILAAPGLTDAGRIAILGGTAAKLLGLGAN
jgi:aminocarboxymuconate-semialdehyde decarboxylase